MEIGKRTRFFSVIHVLFSEDVKRQIVSVMRPDLSYNWLINQILQQCALVYIQELIIYVLYRGETY